MRGCVDIPGTRDAGSDPFVPGLAINQTGPVQMPFLNFAGDQAFERANLFTGEAARRGVYLHPWHNWFLSAAHREDDVRAALERTDEAFADVRRRFGAG